MPTEEERRIGEQLAEETFARFKELRKKLLFPSDLSAKDEDEHIELLQGMLELNKQDAKRCSIIKDLIQGFQLRKRIRAFLPRIHTLERCANKNILTEILDIVEGKITSEEKKNGIHELVYSHNT